MVPKWPLLNLLIPFPQMDVLAFTNHFHFLFTCQRGLNLLSDSLLQTPHLLKDQVKFMVAYLNFPGITHFLKWESQTKSTAIVMEVSIQDSCLPISIPKGIWGMVSRTWVVSCQKILKMWQGSDWAKHS